MIVEALKRTSARLLYLATLPFAAALNGWPGVAVWFVVSLACLVSYAYGRAGGVL